MREELKGLIEKINEEGIKAAEKKAMEIEGQAIMKADEILANAKQKAEALLSSVRQKAQETEERTKVLLAQAARDMLLSVRKEINAMLERVIASEIDSALGTANLERIIMELLKARSEHAEDVVITLKKSELDVLEKKFLSKLKEETKRGIILRASEGIRAGFTISFDKGKSCYDFTDKALVEYIGQYLKPKLNEFLKGAITD